MASHPLVLIEWLDAVRPESDWGLVSEIEDEAAECRSVGWLIRDGAVKVLAPTLSSCGEDEQACGVFRIPSSAVVRIVTLDGSPG